MIGVVLTLAGASLLWISWLGSQRRLPPNRWAGIRVASTMRSDDAWYSAHQASAAALGVGGGIVCFCGVGVIFGGTDVISAGLVVVALVALAVSLTVGTVAALRAARVSPDPGSDRP